MVAHLPEPGVDDVEMRPHELLVGQVTDELERALARISNPIYQLFYRGYASNIAVQCQFLHPMFTWVGDRVETGHNMTSAGIHQAVLRPL